VTNAIQACPKAASFISAAVRTATPDFSRGHRNRIEPRRWENFQPLFTTKAKASASGLQLRES
jgi:hypothetical protein